MQTGPMKGKSLKLSNFTVRLRNKSLLFYSYLISPVSLIVSVELFKSSYKFYLCFIVAPLSSLGFLCNYLVFEVESDYLVSY